MIAAPLPPPDNIQPIEFEQILTQLKADVLAGLPDEQATIDLESDPINELLQAIAYRIMLTRNAANAQAQSIMLVTARGPQLDQLGALPFFDTGRLVLVQADPNASPPIAQVLESDDDYRERLRLSLHGQSVAGPSNAYRFHALSASPNILDVRVDRPTFERDATIYPGLPDDAIVIRPNHTANLDNPQPYDVVVTILLDTQTGVAGQETLDQVRDALNAENVRPVSDNLIVRYVEPVPVILFIGLTYYDGVDQEATRLKSNEQMNQQFAQIRRIGYDLTASAILAAAMVEGVQSAQILFGGSGVTIEPHQIFNVQAFAINSGVADE